MHTRVPLSEYVRPAKWRNAARRRLFVRRLRDGIPMRPCETEYLGTDYGGWPVPLDVLAPGSVVYSVGAGGDVSFDVELIKRVGCQVHSFDPTPEAARHVEALRQPGLIFHNLAIWTHGDKVEMYRAADPANMALSVANLQNTHEAVSVPCRTIEEVRTDLGHDRIDLLKLTVDGGEYELLPTLDLEGWQTRVLVVNVHHNRPARDAIALIDRLRERGFEVVARKGPAGFTFLRDVPAPRGGRFVRGVRLPTAAELANA